ncbi:UvrABC system protein C [Petrocella atlantisensis]|uniref:UvrABC system protein C n=1 Tax=Petrocella atlantisensis TaxID=2173034 RepID=A0A3P7PTW5_9FIRM|nr:excinuclease ABC subunit UvrC [Petrocella atlantisensis]VDN47417.1 UvrABC system protein C [Petrocella atlantisensis]
MFDIQAELNKLPLKPGVYIMKDSQDEILYIGKAIKLRHRVRQYFRKSTHHTNKIKRMVASVASFEYIVTDSELEALILECNLIKKHRPKYNTMLKDDKHYPYIMITLGEPYPRIMIAREMQKDKSKYYGPYTSSFAANEIIELLRKIYKIRNCNRILPRDIGKERACLYYHIHQCDAPCQDYISVEAYREQVHQAIDFLNGHYKKVIEMLETAMYKASEEMDFEKAADYRDQLQSVQTIAQKQKIIDGAMEDKDVIAFAKSETEAIVQVFFIRNGKMIGREHFRLEGIEELSNSDIMSTFVKQFYSGTPYIPKELMLQEELDEANIIQSWLSSKRGQKVYIKVPRKGEKSKLVDLAAENAAITLNQFGDQIKKEAARTKGAVDEIVSLLGMETSIDRIEAFDISNTQGFESVGSMVVFEGGKPKKTDYRKFKIKHVTGPNDYASMEEVLRRRFTHALEEQKEILVKKLNPDIGKFARLPNLILMDGGKGQVNIALSVLESLGLDIVVCGMIKDDQHRTRALLYENREIIMKKSSEAFKLITRIQDEAHRFAIDYHKKLRSKVQIASILDDIEGIGPSRRKALILHFKSVAHIQEASVEELSQAPSMNKKVALKVYEFFHGQSDDIEDN